MSAMPASPADAPNASANPGHTRDSSIDTIADSDGSRADSPPFVGGASPLASSFANIVRASSARPNVLAKSRISSYGGSPFSSASIAGSSFLVVHARTILRICSCSSLNASILFSDQTGMIPRFLAGRSTTRPQLISIARHNSLRVSRGSITSSTRPHPATL